MAPGAVGKHPLRRLGEAFARWPRAILRARLHRMSGAYDNVGKRTQDDKFVDDPKGAGYFGGTAPPAGQVVSPMRVSVISKRRTGSAPGARRSPTSLSVPSLMTAV